MQFKWKRGSEIVKNLNVISYIRLFMDLSTYKVLTLALLTLGRDPLFLQTHLRVGVRVITLLHHERELLEFLRHARINIAVPGQFEYFSLKLAQEVLLRTENTAWSQNSRPRNKISSAKAVMLDRINSDQCSSTAQSSLAVHGNRTLLRLNRVKKLFYDFFTRSGTINEIEIEVFYACLDEFFSIILRLVQSYYHGDAKLLENRYIILRRKGPVLIK